LLLTLRAWCHPSQRALTRLSSNIRPAILWSFKLMPFLLNMILFCTLVGRRGIILVPAIVATVAEISTDWYAKSHYLHNHRQSSCLDKRFGCLIRYPSITRDVIPELLPQASFAYSKHYLATKSQKCWCAFRVVRFALIAFAFQCDCSCSWLDST